MELKLLGMLNMVLEVCKVQAFGVLLNYLPGLTANTSYDMYVQADCGSGSTSAWVGPYTFSTIPNPSCVYTINMIDSYGMDGMELQ